MYCPRCGAPNADTTKFCRQCGLGLTQVSAYVSTGGTAQLTSSQPTPVSQLAQMTASYSPKQKMTLTILALIFLPGLLAVMSDFIGLADALVPVAGIFMCLGIPWAVIHFRNQQRLLDQHLRQEQMHQQAILPQLTPQPYALAPQRQPEVPRPSQTPLQQTPAQQPNYQDPQAVPQGNSPKTNPLGTAGSVTEDETQRLQKQ